VFALFLPLKQTVSTRADAPAAAPPPAPTYYRDVQPIVAEHCVSCHREGHGAPFPLGTYRDVEKRAPQIAQVTQAAFMPPWKPDSHGELVGANRLSAAEIDILQRWAAGNAPEGRPTAKVVSSQARDSGLGTPDAVLIPAAPSRIPAAGPDFYRCFTLPTRFAGDKYLSAIVYQSGNPAVSDHALEYVDVSHRVRFMNEVAPGGSFTVQGSTTGLLPATLIGGWGIATPPGRFPAGSGILLPKGADIVVEAHYRPTGKPETDLPHVLLYFCKGPVTRRVRVAPVMAQNLRLPPNFTDIHVGGQRPVIGGISILAVLPYMRHHGTAISLDALLPDKSRKSILDIPQWDFDWVGNYRFRKPVRIPAGSLLTMEGGFNNGAPAGKTAELVSWGDAVSDENAVAYVFYTTDDESLGHRIVAGIPEPGGPTQAGMHKVLLKIFDANHNGTIDPGEYIQMRGYFRGAMPSMAGMEM
jgi:hypothetical protein